MAGAFTEADNLLYSNPCHRLTSIAGIFQRLVPYAATHGLRLVRVNMRDYRGSSKFTEEELAAITDGDADSQAAVFKDMGLQVAAFLEHFSKKHAIPRITESNGKARGGIVLLAWSMGCIFATSMLGHALSLPESTKESLDQYLRTVILHGERYAFLSTRQLR